MLLLATWLLGHEGLTWADMGLRRRPWRRFAAVTFGGFLAVTATGFLARLIDRHLGLSAPDYSMMAPLRGDLIEYLFWLVAGRNLWPGIVIHAITDATAITVFYAGVPVH